MLAYIRWRFSTRRKTTRLVTKFEINPLPPNQGQFWSKRRYPVLIELCFEPAKLGFGGKKPRSAQKCSCLTHKKGCYNAWHLLFPPSTSQLQTPHFALKAQSYTSSEVSIPLQPLARRLRHLSQFWAPSHFLPYIPNLQRKHARETERWSHAVSTHLRSDIWSPKLLRPSKARLIYQVYYVGGMKEELCSSTCF